MDTESIASQYIHSNLINIIIYYICIYHAIYIDIIHPLEFRPFVRVGKKKFRM